jgi:DNA-binding NarL/FixJ family response regulator
LSFTKSSSIAVLDKGGFDVILCDSSLPGFDGKAALAMAQAKCPEAPFLFVSGHFLAARMDGLTPAGAKAVISKSDLKSLVDAMLAALKIKRPD